MYIYKHKYICIYVNIAVEAYVFEGEPYMKYTSPYMALAPVHMLAVYYHRDSCDPSLHNMF